MRNIISDLLELIYPRLCVVCNDKLKDKEEHICLNCLLKIPLTKHNKNEFQNELTDLFSGRFLFEKAVSFAYYIKGGSIQKIIHEIKYNHNTKLAHDIGRQAGKRFINSELFNDIDYLVPIPLHKRRLRERGYNQAELIAKGISESANIPVCASNINRSVYNISQTKNTKTERWLNVSNIFELIDLNMFKEKHILLVDDVITTGSTLESCIKEITHKCDVRISIISIALAI